MTSDFRLYQNASVCLLVCFLDIVRYLPQLLYFVALIVITFDWRCEMWRRQRDTYVIQMQYVNL